MTLSRRVIALSVGVLVIFAVALIAGVGESPPLEDAPQETAHSALVWSVLGSGALIGALAAALGTHLLRQRATERREAREIEGLVRLICSEMVRNRVASRLFSQHPHLIAEGVFTSLTMDTWGQVRRRLVQLMPPHDFEEISAYYVALESHLVLLEGFRAAYGRADEETWHQTVRDHLIEAVDPAQERTIMTIRKYVDVDEMSTSSQQPPFPPTS